MGRSGVSTGVSRGVSPGVSTGVSRARFHHCAGLAVILGVLAMPSLAHAQWGIWGVLQELRKPAVTARVLKQYSDILQLRPEQQNAVDELLFAYEREQRRIGERFDKISQSINEEYEYDEDQDVQPWRDVWPKVNRTFFARSMKLNAGILDDLKAVLDQAQAQRWPQVERLSRRRTTLTWGGRAADQIDLVDLIKGLRLNETTSASIAGTLEQYELDLDRELLARIKYVQDQSEAWFKMMEQYDEVKWAAMAKELGEVNKKVGDVNDRFRRQFMSELPEEVAKEFDLRIKQAIYPKIYRQSHTQMALAAAEKIEGLDAATIEGIKGVRENYERDAAAANEKWAQALAAQDEQIEKDSAGQNMWWGNWRPEDPKVRETRAARRAIDKKATAAIAAMLTEEQRAKLPDRKWRPEWDLDAEDSPK